MKAAKANNIAWWPTWMELKEWQRAEIVAFYRLEHLIELHYKLQELAEIQAKQRAMGV